MKLSLLATSLHYLATSFGVPVKEIAFDQVFVGTDGVELDKFAFQVEGKVGGVGVSYNVAYDFTNPAEISKGITDIIKGIHAGMPQMQREIIKDLLTNQLCTIGLAENVCRGDTDGD